MKRIETSNLRIGNIIDFNGRLFKVKEIYVNSILGFNISDQTDIETISENDIKGLKINEKLLNLLGWSMHDGNNFKLDNSKAPLTSIEGHLDIECPYDENGIRVFISLKEGLGTAVNLNYLHELQNLFLALHFKEI